MFKKIVALFLCLLTLSAVACKNQKPQESETPKATYQLALITSDTELELDFSYASLWEGIISIAEANALSYGFYRPDDMSDSALRQQFSYAIRDGASVIICMGDAFKAIVQELAKENESIRFILIDASLDEYGKNIHSVQFSRQQGSYIAGYAAVHDGFRKVAFMGTDKSDANTDYAYGFVQGIYDAAKVLETQVEINVSYVSDHADEESAKEYCKDLYKNGAELIMLSTSDAFSQACATLAVEFFGYTVGTNHDHSYLAATLDYNPYITSTMIGLREAIDTTLELLIADKWDSELSGKAITYGLEKGNYIYLPDHEATWLFSGYTLDDYNQLKNKISQSGVTVNTVFPAEDNGFVKITE